jgi:hypothetical protein
LLGRNIRDFDYPKEWLIHEKPLLLSLPAEGETMKRLIYSLVSLSIFLFACNVSTAVTPPVVTAPPVDTFVPVNTAAQEVATAAVIPPTETPPGPQANVTCKELSLYLDPSLASGYDCETVPESPDGMEIYPQYTNITLSGYVLSGKFFEAHISVFPVQRYDELISDLIPGRISDLQALIGGGAAGDPLPFLPTFNAAQVFHAQYRVLPFASGGGIRYLTEYAQYFAPINNTDLFYTYQGLTNDGKYWLSAILPINNPILPADASNPPDSNNFESYISDMITQLNSQASDTFTPSLALLDELVSSITIQP